MPGKPIKRNENIVPLSRDHHFGLLFCWKIRQGLKAKIELERVRKYILYFWKFHLEQHFNEEETLLFSQVQNKLCDDGFSQHKEIRNIIARFTESANDNEELYALLASLVDEHIRFEERILFPYLESVLPVEKLGEIGTQLKEMHVEPSADNYSDEFWIKNNEQHKFG
ncbi:MAG: hemerythrin domain-containing protein [Chitinophagales bacterium]|nr:hemerythrin domain-containing protein [Chitinophagales bacterium]